MNNEAKEGQPQRRIERQRRRRTRPGTRPVIDTSIPSPCINVCRIEGDYCIGCYRSGDEIRDWIIMTAEQKTTLLDIIQTRRSTHS